MNWIAVPLAGLTVVSTLAGGYVALRLHRELTTLIALTGGVVVGVALFDVLPEAIDAVDNAAASRASSGSGSSSSSSPNGCSCSITATTRAGAAHEQVGVLGAAGLSLHSFIDGFGIGLAFGVNTSTGLLVFVAVSHTTSPTG